MALCLADSILANNFKFNGVDMRHRFMLWWFKGLNNGRADDPKQKISFGLGNTTMNSFMYFAKRQTEFVALANTYSEQNNSNGSIMRLAPVPIAFHDDLQAGLEFAEKQSRSTHNGYEASALCQLLTFLVIRFLELETPADCKDLLDSIEDEFKTDNSAVETLMKSEVEEDFSEYYGKYCTGSEDRDWNWRARTYKFSSSRMEAQKDYTGIYSMDNVAMALHIVYNTKSLKDAILKAVNLGGDCDSIGAVVGMLAGAMYGYDDFAAESYKWVQPWDKSKTAIRAYKLFHKIPVTADEKVEIKKEKKIVMFDA
jgi:ADP-ribosyl-[dinitrogen reductase] hydrolase